MKSFILVLSIALSAIGCAEDCSKAKNGEKQNPLYGNQVECPADVYFVMSEKQLESRNEFNRRIHGVYTSESQANSIAVQIKEYDRDNRTYYIEAHPIYEEQ